MSMTLVDRLTSEHGYPELDEETIESFVTAHDHVVLFFSGDPKQHPEGMDVAVSLPELMKRYGDRMAAAVIAPKAQRTLQKLYGFREFPSLVFLTRGEFVGFISRVQNWGDYIAEFDRILVTPPSRAPGLGLPIVG